MEKIYRTGLFLLVCITVRLLFAYASIYIFNLVDSSKTKNKLKLSLEIITLGIGIAFMFQYINNKKTGFFGGNVWWSNLRLIHSINYLSYSYLSYINYKKAPLILVFDVVVGLIGFIMKEVLLF